MYNKAGLRKWAFRLQQIDKTGQGDISERVDGGEENFFALLQFKMQHILSERAPAK